MSISNIKPINDLPYTMEDLTTIRQYIDSIRESCTISNISGHESYKNQGSITLTLTELGYPSIFHPIIFEINDIDSHTYEWTGNLILPDRTTMTNILEVIGYK